MLSIRRLVLIFPAVLHAIVSAAGIKTRHVASTQTRPDLIGRPKYHTLPPLREQATLQDSWTKERRDGIPKLLRKYGIDAWLVCSLSASGPRVPAWFHGIQKLTGAPDKPARIRRRHSILVPEVSEAIFRSPKDYISIPRRRHGRRPDRPRVGGQHPDIMGRTADTP